MAIDKGPADNNPQSAEKKLIHRDDVPLDVIKEIEQKMAELHPGKKIVFVGDAPEGTLPPSIMAAMEKLDRHWKRCFVCGLCVDCGARIPCIWPPPEDDSEDWDMPKGWKMMYEGLSAEDSVDGEEGNPCGLICPDCDAGEKDGGMHAISDEFFENFDYGDAPTLEEIADFDDTDELEDYLNRDDEE